MWANLLEHLAILNIFELLQYAYIILAIVSIIFFIHATIYHARKKIMYAKNAKEYVVPGSQLYRIVTAIFYGAHALIASHFSNDYMANFQITNTYNVFPYIIVCLISYAILYVLIRVLRTIDKYDDLKYNSFIAERYIQSPIYQTMGVIVVWYILIFAVTHFNQWTLFQF